MFLILDVGNLIFPGQTVFIENADDVIRTVVFRNNRSVAGIDVSPQGLLHVPDRIGGIRIGIQVCTAAKMFLNDRNVKNISGKKRHYH